MVFGGREGNNCSLFHVCTCCVSPLRRPSSSVCLFRGQRTRVGNNTASCGHKLWAKAIHLRGVFVQLKKWSAKLFLWRSPLLKTRWSENQKVLSNFCCRSLWKVQWNSFTVKHLHIYKYIYIVMVTDQPVAHNTVKDLDMCTVKGVYSVCIIVVVECRFGLF